MSYWHLGTSETGRSTITGLGWDYQPSRHAWISSSLFPLLQHLRSFWRRKKVEPKYIESVVRNLGWDVSRIINSNACLSLLFAPSLRLAISFHISQKIGSLPSYPSKPQFPLTLVEIWDNQTLRTPSQTLTQSMPLHKTSFLENYTLPRKGSNVRVARKPSLRIAHSLFDVYRVGCHQPSKLDISAGNFTRERKLGLKTGGNRNYRWGEVCVPSWKSSGNWTR